MIRKVKILDHHDRFEKQIENIIKYGLDIVSDNNYKVDEKEIILEGLLLRACALWEKFLGIEIVYLISFDPRKLLQQIELPANTSLTVNLIKAILFSNRFLDFNDIDKTKHYFKTYLVREFNPLNNVSSNFFHRIRFTYRLRNYLAHYSDYSKRKLKEELVNKYNYTLFVEPGKFLRKQNGKYFEQLIHNFSLISATMRKSIK
ncbi:MAG: hypothetical protein O6940_03600 [Ignavibacteria bacterium]|nr:hypothetical protein [Ignavibacteria bacterium]